MADLNVAWSVLSNPRRRAAYDRTLVTVRGDAVLGPIAARRAAARGSDTAARSSATSPTVLDFGRYAGWSLGEIAQQDADYLVWLATVPLGRHLQAEIGALLAGARNYANETSRSRARGWRALSGDVDSTY
jgi:hypothetical protein